MQIKAPECTGYTNQTIFKPSDQYIDDKRRAELATLVLFQRSKFGSMTRASQQDDELSVDDLMFLVEFCNDKSIQYGAYLRLIKHGKLEDIKRLARFMDFEYMHMDHEDAVHAACIYARLDVLHFLIEELMLTFQQYDDSIFHIAMDAVAMSGQYKQWHSIQELVKAVSAGGFGYQPSRDVLLKYPQDSNVVTIQTYPVNQADTFTVLNVATNSVEVYREDTYLNEGAYGSVSLYKSDHHACVVKKPLENWVKSTEIELGQQFDGLWALAQREFHGMKTAYPNEGPYALIKAAYQIKSITYHSYRLIMPYYQGETFGEAFKKCPDMISQISLILAAAKELQSFHAKGYIHNDIHQNNIMIDKMNDHSFMAHLIDFSFYRKANNDYFQDIDNFAGMLQFLFYCQLYPEKIRYIADGEFAESCINEVCSYLESNESFTQESSPVFNRFPTLKKFIHLGITGDLDKQLSLNDFITQLSQELLTQPKTLTTQSKREYFKRDGFFSRGKIMPAHTKTCAPEARCNPKPTPIS